MIGNSKFLDITHLEAARKTATYVHNKASTHPPGLINTCTASSASHLPGQHHAYLTGLGCDSFQPQQIIQKNLFIYLLSSQISLLMKLTSQEQPRTPVQLVISQDRVSSRLTTVQEKDSEFANFGLKMIRAGKI